jgi:hypothetical protein
MNPLYEDFCLAYQYQQFFEKMYTQNKNIMYLNAIEYYEMQMKIINQKIIDQRLFVFRGDFSISIFEKIHVTYCYRIFYENFYKYYKDIPEVAFAYLQKAAEYENYMKTLII